MKPLLTFDKFLVIQSQLEIKLGTILSAEFLPKNKKMLKLTVSFGSEDIRTVVTNIGDKIQEPEVTLKGLQFPFVTNLESAVLSGIESTAMILVTETNGVVETSLKTDGAKLI